MCGFALAPGQDGLHQAPHVYATTSVSRCSAGIAGSTPAVCLACAMCVHAVRVHASLILGAMFVCRCVHGVLTHTLMAAPCVTRENTLHSSPQHVHKVSHLPH